MSGGSTSPGGYTTPVSPYPGFETSGPSSSILALDFDELTSIDEPQHELHSGDIFRGEDGRSTTMPAWQKATSPIWAPQLSPDIAHGSQAAFELHPYIPGPGLEHPEGDCNSTAFQGSDTTPSLTFSSEPDVLSSEPSLQRYDDDLTHVRDSDGSRAATESPSVPTATTTPVTKKNIASAVGIKASSARRTKDAKFACDRCARSFTTNYNLKNHQMTHENVRNYKCERCMRRFMTNGVLRRHEKTCGGVSGGSATADYDQEVQRTTHGKPTYQPVLLGATSEDSVHPPQVPPVVQPASLLPVSQVACFAAKGALEHLKIHHYELIRALKCPGSHILALAGFNEELLGQDIGYLQEIHIFPATEIALEPPTLNEVGKLCSPFPSMIFMPSGSTFRPPLYDGEGKPTTFDDVVSSLICKMRYEDAMKEELNIVPPRDSDTTGNPETRTNEAASLDSTFGSAGQGPSGASQASHGGAGGRASQQYDMDNDESENERGEAAENATGTGKQPYSPSQPSGERGSGSPGPGDGSKTRQPQKVHFDIIAAIHQASPRSELIQELQLIGGFNFRFNPGQSAMVQFTRMKCQAHRSPSAYRYSQGYLKILIDTFEPRWKVSSVTPTSTLASDSQEKRTESGKTGFQQAAKLALRFNPFASGVNLEGTRNTENSTGGERVQYNSRIIQRERLGVFWWGFDVDDEHAKEGGVDLVKASLPSADLSYLQGRRVEDAGPAAAGKNLRVEVSSFWSLIRKGSPWFPATLGDSLPPAYSNLCQIACLDLNPTLEEDGNYVALMAVGSAGPPAERLTVICDDNISVTPAVLMLGDVDLGMVVDERFMTTTED